MEDRKAKIIAVVIVIVLIVSIIIARISLGLSNTFYLITGANGAAIIAVIAILLLRKRYNKRCRILETQMALSHYSDQHPILSESVLRREYSLLRKVAGVPTVFQHREIEVATDGFNSKNLLGRGASGSVFKGILDDGTPVAVKQIEGRDEKLFRSEVAAIGSVQHVNLVRLLGYCCVPTGPRFLVYDFIPNGSLEKWIFPRKPKEKASSRGKIQHIGGCLDWCSRVRVAHDVAKALSYLHHDCRSKILHFDVKPENILLDQNYHAFVTDFGLSKLMALDESKIVTLFRGTRGYVAPEWISRQEISEKCDVYSFGIVLLEMVGGTRSVIRGENCIDRSKPQFFPKIVCKKLREGKVMEVVDKRVVGKGGIDEREVRRLVCIGLWCVQDESKMRPSMAKVVEMLEGHVAVEEPPENEMMVDNMLSYEEGMSSSSGHDSSGLVMEGDNSVHHSSGSHSIYLTVLSGR